MNFQNIFLFFLWVFACLKSGDSACNVFNSEVTLIRVQNPTQIGSILGDISEKVLVIVTIKKFLKFLKCYNSQGHKHGYMQVQIIEKVTPNTEFHRLEREEFWIKKLATKIPMGLNTMD